MVKVKICTNLFENLIFFKEYLKNFIKEYFYYC